MSAFDPKRTLVLVTPPYCCCHACYVSTVDSVVTASGATMRRREFITLAGGAAVFWPLAARAQRLDRVRRIGVLLPYIESDSQAQARVTALQTALEKRGWASGRDVVFEFRYAEGQLDRLPALAADLVHTNVDVILAAGSESTDAARKATTKIPIVMATVGDPIAAGFITSLARPGGNVTGASLFATELTAKRLGLLKEFLPALTRLAVLWSANNASAVQKFKQIEQAAPVQRVQLDDARRRV